VAFLRFSRDKRGYEHFYLVEPTTNRRGKTRARVLYWFRTPPNVKVGREPFDEEIRRTLESKNPGVSFDWRKIVETPIPSADAERWRERRREERAARAARKEGAEGAAPPPDAVGAIEPGDEIEPMLEPADLDREEAPADGEPDADAGDLTVDAAEQQADALAATEESLVATAATIEPEVSTPRRKRRRRRRGSRGSQGSQGSEPGAPVEPREPGEPRKPS